jgi:hypothetical protein
LPSASRRTAAGKEGRIAVRPRLCLREGSCSARRTYAEGKKITWRDGAAALFHIVRYRFFG